MEKRRIIIMFGPPGSGKGIIGDALAERFGFFKISTGDILRDEVKKQTPLGIDVADAVLNGELIDDDIVNNLVTKLLTETHQDVLLDGYPRNFSQGRFLLDLLKDKYSLDCVYLEADKEFIISRIEQRRICEDCGKTHFAKDGKCPVCGGKSIIRNDDKLIRKRFNHYQWFTEQVFWKMLKPVCFEVHFIDCSNIPKAIEKTIDAFTPF